ncbi:hypothetical protein T11_9599 [Trichinella zimbabwensis]|uniref:Uncharacterized protein n=1 Tax=Trichinella zimbabwensis TaxID=268475 RepID=A0A0V1HBY4_9BILA|nr:hypothetical protein T11_9599 [Trichinella zimbabwensis]
MYSMLIAKSPVKIVQSERPIREKRMYLSSIFHLSDFLLTVAVRDKSAKERNCIKFGAGRGWKHGVFNGKLTEDHQHQTPNNSFAFYSLLFFGIISEK